MVPERPVPDSGTVTADSPASATAGTGLSPYSTRSTGEGGDAAPLAALGEAGDLPLLAVPEQNYRILGEQGRGGIGVVLRARDLRLGRTVAVKQLQSPRGAAHERFEREMRITARLQHPGVVPVHEAGCFASGVPFYAMKLIEGRSLRQCIEEARTPGERVTLLPHVLAVAETVAYAHSQRVIHRDLKPGNVIVGAYGEAVVIDWGLAKILGEPGAAPAADAAEPTTYDTGDSGEGLTIAGEIVGTPGYMSPEQARGRAVDERADVWSLGALLYHVLAGAPAYSGHSSQEILRRAQEGPPPPLPQLVPDVAPELNAIVTRAMARDPAARYANAGELAADLRRFQNGQLVGAYRYTLAKLIARWVRRHRAAVAVGALSLVVLAVGGVVGVQRVLASRAAALRESVLAEDARADADQRARDLMLAQARTLLVIDPSRSLAWLRAYLDAGGDARRARILAGDAWTRGPARWVEPEDTSRVYFLPGASRRLITIHEDGRVELRDLATGTVRALGQTSGRVISAGIGPHGELATCESDRTLLVWDLVAARREKIDAGCMPTLGDPEFVADGTKLLIADRDNHLTIVDVRTRMAGLPPAGAGGNYTSSPDGTRILSGDDHDLVVWQPDGTVVTRVHSPGKLRSLAWAPDGASFAGLAEDQTITVWSVAGAAVARFSGASAGYITFAAGGRTVVEGGTDGILRAWDLGASVPRELGRGRRPFSYVHGLPDGVHVLTNSNQQDFTLYRVDDGDYQPLVAESANQAFDDFDLADDGRMLALAGTRELRVVDLGDEALRVLVGCPAHKNAFMAVAPDGAHAATVGEDGALLLVDLVSGAQKVLAHVDLPALVRGTVSVRRGARIVFAPGSDALAVSFADGTIVEYDREGKVLGRLVGHVGEVFGLVWGKDGAIYSSGDDGTVRMWEGVGGAGGASSGVVIGRHEDAVRVMVLSPSGRWLASGDRSGRLALWDVRERRLVQDLHGHEGAALVSLAFSPDERYLASGGTDRPVRLWDLGNLGRAGGVGVRELLGHRHYVLSLAFSPDGRTLASGSADGTIKLWDTAGARAGAEGADGAGRTLIGHTGGIVDLDFSPDGQRLVSAGSQDDSARLWDLATGESRIVRHKCSAFVARFVDGGRKVLSGRAELRLWSDEIPGDVAHLRRWIEDRTDARVTEATSSTGGAEPGPR